MASGIGIAELDFGVFPGASEASIAVPGQAAISATSVCEAYFMADDVSSDSSHTGNDHKYIGIFAALSCGTPVAATGFTIYARSIYKLIGKFKVRWVWSD